MCSSTVITQVNNNIKETASKKLQFCTGECWRVLTILPAHARDAVMIVVSLLAHGAG